MLKYFFYVVGAIMLLHGGCHAETILSDSDVRLYRQVFQAQQLGDFKTAQNLQSKIQNHLLDGYNEPMIYTV